MSTSQHDLRSADPRSRDPNYVYNSETGEYQYIGPPPFPSKQNGSNFVAPVRLSIYDLVPPDSEMAAKLRGDDPTSDDPTGVQRAANTLRAGSPGEITRVMPESEFRPSQSDIPARNVDKYADNILPFFDRDRLTAAQSLIAAPFVQIAHTMVESLESSPERTIMLRKLLEAQDAALRCALVK